MDYTSTESVKRLQKALSDLEQKLSTMPRATIGEESSIQAQVSSAFMEEFEALQKEHKNLKEKQSQSRLKVESLITKVEEALN